MQQKINFKEKLSLFSEHWTPKIISEFNDNYLKLAKVKGEFVWHDHTNEDELFIIIKGELDLVFKDEIINLKEGECFVVPKSVQHKPYAKEECHLLLVEPKSTKHTGEVNDLRTKNKLDWI